MMKKYPAYKNSGLLWLNEIPTHWGVRRLKHLVKNINDQRAAIRDGELCIALENIESWTGKFIPSSEVTELQSSLKCFQPEDVLFSKLRPYLAKALIAERQGLCVSELLVLRVDKKRVLPKFLIYNLLTKHIIDVIDSSTFGAKMPRAEWAFIGNLDIALPPLDEQQAIVEYLNNKQEKIDHFINNKLRLITLLQEKKTSLINRVVTRGINPHTQLKPSGISWLGTVPDHWEIKRAKFFFHEVDERSESGEEELLSVSHITGVTPRSEKNITMFMAESYEGYKTCRPEDLVINIMWAWMGALGVSEYQGIVSSAYGVYRQKNTNDFFAPYLDYLLRTKSYVAEFTCRSKGVTSSRARMYSDDFFDVPIVRPPHEEQVAIVQHIRHESAAIDAAIAKTKQEIELIKEFRTVLITDCVTGKIDVSQVQAEVLPMPLKRVASPSVTPEFKRALLAAEIIYLQHQDPTFGRVKFQKTLHLCEYQIQIDELGSDYKREAAGPHDSRMLYQIESQLKKSKWFECVGIRNEQHRYIPLEKVETYKKYFERHWGERRAAIHSMINLLKPLDSEQCEIVSTLYAAWNDLLLTKQAASDEAIIQDVLSWHESKLRIPEDRWRRALKWMRDHGLVPAGFGKPTHRLARQPKSKSKA